MVGDHLSQGVDIVSNRGDKNISLENLQGLECLWLHQVLM